MTKLYVIRIVNRKDECKVVHVKTWKAVFFGTRAECKDWIEVNGHDDWN